MDMLPPSQMIRIFGMTIHLERRLEHMLLVKFRCDGSNSSPERVYVSRRGKHTGTHMFWKPLSLLEGTTLTVQVKEKHYIRKSEILARINISPEDIWRGQHPDNPDGQPRKYQLHLDDPEKQIWLNFDVISSTPRSGPNDAGHNSHKLKNTPPPVAGQAAEREAILQNSENSLDCLDDTQNPVDMQLLPDSQDLKDLRSYLHKGIKTVDPRATECIPGTRTKILADIATKTNESDDANIIWIRGAPGSGKSSLSLSATSQLRVEGCLVTYFRFDRNEVATTTSTSLWRHVAYDLARRLPTIQQNLLWQLRADRVDLNSPMAVFTSLVEDSLSRLTDRPYTRPLVIVVDALDECGGLAGHLSSDRQTLLQTLERWSRLPKHFKLLVTSREEGDISRILSSISTPIEVPSGHRLVEDPLADASIHVSNDIRTFLEVRFRRVRARIPSLPTDWPGADTVADMVCRAAGIFMWAMAAANFIDCRGIDPVDRLHKIMGYAQPQSNIMKPLYSLYAAILETAFGDIGSGDVETEALRSVLGTMILTRRPLHDTEYTKMLTAKSVTRAMLDSIRDGLRSVVAPGSNLRFMHKSFDDFLLSSECPSKYRIEADECQHLLTKFCLETLTKELHFNMCGLGTSHLKNADVPDIEMKVTNGIPELLSYSCCFWAEHLYLTPFDESLLSEVRVMILDKLLFWFEAMSLLKEMDRVSRSLLLVLKWSHLSSDEEFRDFVRDARQFIGLFIHPIAQSAPHIYISALPFTPQNSLVSRHFLPHFPRLLSIPIGKQNNWPSCIFTSEHHDDEVYSVTFSPDEKYFASGCADGIVWICDSETGYRISGPFRGDSKVEHLFFEPDGRRVWVSYYGGQVVGWNTETGVKYLTSQDQRIVGCSLFNGGQKLVLISNPQGTTTLRNADTGKDLCDLPFDAQGNKVLLSANGCYIAYAGARDTTVKIWELVDGGEIQGQSHSQPQFEHAESISALSFSLDGKFIVSGSEDGTILVWDASSGHTVGRPLVTGGAEVDAVAYSPKTNLIVSASGDPGTLTVWDALTHEAVLGPLDGHTSQITKIALSHNCQRALTTSCDKTVKMWDLGKRVVVPETHVDEAHAGPVRSVTFSPCGRKLASLGDDRTIRIWDTNTVKPLYGPINSISSYSRIIFSPDGSQILAHGSNDGTLRIWNAGTGGLLFYKDLSDDNQQHTHIRQASFRSTDQQLVTCSDNGIVRIWKLTDGVMIEDASVSSPQPVNTSVPVKIIALSPDGSTAIVRDTNRNPVHYMWSTITCQHLPITFADDEDVSSNRFASPSLMISGGRMAYSPSGRFFANVYSESSMSHIILVWNTQTGELLTSSESRHHGRAGSLTFSHDDSYIAFSSSQRSGPDRFRRSRISILRIRPGCKVSGPWIGHNDTITALSFSPDGKKLVSVSEDGQLRLWNTAVLLGDSEVPVGFPGIEKRMSMQDGWVVDGDGKILFWVPKDHRGGLFWPGNVAIVGGKGISTKLDFTRFRYGEDWAECFGGGI